MSNNPPSQYRGCVLLKELNCSKHAHQRFLEHTTIEQAEEILESALDFYAKYGNETLFGPRPPFEDGDPTNVIHNNSINYFTELLREKLTKLNCYM